MKYKVGDIITVKVSVVNIDADGDLECCQVGCEKDYRTDDTDTMFFDKNDVVDLISSSKDADVIVKSHDECPHHKIKYTDHPKKEQSKKKLYRASGLSLVEGRWQSCGWTIEANSFAEAAQIAEADKTFRIHELSDCVVY